jgi:hypothetical protein
LHGEICAPGTAVFAWFWSNTLRLGGSCTQPEVVIFVWCANTVRKIRSRWVEPSRPIKHVHPRVSNYLPKGRYRDRDPATFGWPGSRSFGTGALHFSADF